MRIRLKPIAQQIIVVTGATSGNGLATAEEAVARGARVVLAARNVDALEEVAVRFRSQGGHVAVCAADVADPDQVERIADTAIQQFGGFDSWVNNAAAATYGAMEEVTLADHRRIFDVNYFGVLHGSLTAARYLRSRGGGAIINLGSVLSDRAMILQGPYSATKAAVQAATDALRMELEQDGAPISVTLIKPGAIHTPYPEHAKNYMDAPPRLPAPLYDPRLVADAVLFACEHPRRHLYVGGGGYAVSLAGKLAPRLTDLAMQTFGTAAQQSPDDAGVLNRRDNLYEPRPEGTVDGAQNARVRRTSFLLQAQKMSLPTPDGLIRAGLSAVADLAEAMDAARYRNRKP